MLISDNLLKICYDEYLVYWGYHFNMFSNTVVLKASVLVNDKIIPLIQEYPIIANDFLLQSFSMPLPEGFLISASIEFGCETLNTASSHGFLSISRNIGNVQIPYTELITGFWDFKVPLIWNISGHSCNEIWEKSIWPTFIPVIGAIPFIFLGSLSEKYRVSFLKFSLTTSAIAHARTIHLIRTNSIVIGNEHIVGINQAASLTYTYIIHDFRSPESQVGLNIYSPWNDNFLNGSFDFEITVDGAQAGDTLSNLSLVLERIT